MNKKLIIAAFAIVVVWLLVLTYLPNKTAENNETNKVNEYVVSGISTDLSKIVEENRTSIVAVDQNENVSSGFIYKKIDNNLYVVTTLHGVSDDAYADIILNSGAKLKGTVINKDIYLDLALIKCDCAFDVIPLELGDSSLVKAGEFVIGIGTCGKLDYAFSSQFGMVSSEYREVECDVDYDDINYQYNIGAIQLSGEFSEGYSGTPVLNMFGQAIGIINSKDENVTLASTINEVKIVLDKMMNNEEYHRLNIGVSGKYINKLENFETANLNIGIDIVNGYYVNNVKVASFAGNTGIIKGDIIHSINGKTIVDENSMLDIIYSNENEYAFEVIRNNENIVLTGTIND